MNEVQRHFEAISTDSIEANSDTQFAAFELRGPVDAAADVSPTEDQEVHVVESDDVLRLRSGNPIKDGSFVWDRPIAAKPVAAALYGEAMPDLLRDELLCEIFAATVAATPNAPAMLSAGCRVSYLEANERAEAVARGLVARGVGPGDVVGLWMARGPDLLIAQIAIAKSGAAWLPFDADAPLDRIGVCLVDANAEGLLTSSEFACKIGPSFAAPVLVDKQIAVQGNQPLPSPRALGATPDDPAYLIYTSGSTGKPKGIVVTARNICHYLRSANAVYGISSSDIVFQGASVAFDLSMEEIWIPYLVGATLFVATPDVINETEALPRLLESFGVTVLDTVPTLLSMLPRDVKNLRVIILGGEVCPPSLVERWFRPGRAIFNTYGPSEATVVATIAQLRPDEPVTIGRPIPNYSCYVVNETLELLGPGVEGELLIGGPGVARGYLRRKNLTTQKFISNPFLAGGRDPVLYRSGDAASLDEHGNLCFRGRIDDQVKIRGFRVELGEIETTLRQRKDIRQAAVALRDDAGFEELVAFIVIEPGSLPAARELRDALRASLPAYMVPARYEFVESLPRLPSGKVDRKALKSAPLTTIAPIEGRREQPRGDTEALLLKVAECVLPPGAIPFEADFFNDLGGHSLLAAKFVSEARQSPRLAAITLKDIYEQRTLRALAVQLDERMQQTDTRPQSEAYARPESRRNGPSLAFTVLQACLILGLAAILSSPALIALPIADDLLRGRTSIVQALLLLTPLLLALWPLTLAISLGAKWLIIGRYRPGAYRLWGSYYLKWWLVSGLQTLSGAGMLTGTPLMPLYFRLMGAKVGRGNVIETSQCSIFDLVSIGDDTSIGADSQILGYRIENGYLILGRIDIGNRCFVGTRCALGLNTRMGDGAQLDDQSLLPDDAFMVPGEQRQGSPAQSAQFKLIEGKPSRPSAGRMIGFTSAALTASSCVAFISSLPALAALWVWLQAFQRGWLWTAIWVTAALTPVFVALTCLWIAMLKAILLRRAKPGVYPLYSFYHLRHWLASGLMRASRTLLLPIFSTLYLPPWLRLLGAKIGPRTEIASIWSLAEPELLTAGEGCFFADGCILGGQRTYGGRFEIRPVSVGSRSFVGNSAMLPGGASLGDNCLVGVLSVPPPGTERTPDGSEWLGSPGFRLPKRLKVEVFDEGVTFRPGRKLYAQRALIDACRILIPAYAAFAIGVSGLAATLYSYEVYGLKITFALLPALGLLAAAVGVAIVVALKWAVMGRYRPVVVPLWSRYVWFNEMITGVYESIMAPVVAGFFGTPFAAPLLRLLGCKIGRDCYIGTSLVSEFDLVDIGNYVALNIGATIQNHLFEDRIMKSSYLRIGDGCSVANMAVVLYDSKMEDGSVLGPLSLLMKGEAMPARSRRHGIPTMQG